MKDAQNESDKEQNDNNFRSTELQMDIEEQDAELDMILGAYDNIPNIITTSGVNELN